MKENNVDYVHIVDENNPPKPFPKVKKEYDKDDVHYIEYDDGSVLMSTSTIGNNEYYTYGDNWKTKKDYIKQMNWFNKILYYLCIIVLYKKLPIKRTGHLISDEPFLQTCQGSTYSSYWHWNWWNPLTYVVAILFVGFMFLMNVALSIIQTLKMTSIVKIDIED